MLKFNFKQARRFLEERDNSRRLAMREKYDRACMDFDAITGLIIKKYNPVRIYQWGSLLSFDRFSNISDIDIAVEGITSAEEFFRLYGEIMDLTDLSVDIVQMEKIEPEFADIIRIKGKLIYEREG